MLETLSFDTRFSPENIEIVYNLYLDYKFELILKIRSILLQSNQWIKALKKNHNNTSTTILSIMVESKTGKSFFK